MEQQVFDINSLKIAKPCSASWAKMDGDARARFCGLCQKNVYNVAGMTRDEVHSLMKSHGDAPCLRLRRRHDGTIVTKDCPIGVSGARRRLLFTVTGTCFLVWTALAATKITGRPSAPPTTEEFVADMRTKPLIGPLIDKLSPAPPAPPYVIAGAMRIAYPMPSSYSNNLGLEAAEEIRAEMDSELCAEE